MLHGVPAFHAGVLARVLGALALKGEKRTEFLAPGSGLTQLGTAGYWISRLVKEGSISTSQISKIS